MLFFDHCQAPSHADFIYSQACQRQTNTGNINIPLNVSIKILSKFPLQNYLLQPHTSNLNIKTEKVNRCQMIIQLRYILDIPYHALLPKPGVFLACIDALQHLRKETDLIWKNPSVFEEQTKQYMRSCPGELGLQQTLTLNSGMNIFV